MPTDLLDLLGPPGWCSGCWRTMVRSPAAPSPVRFSGLLFADSGADDGARAVGATDDDVGFAWSARWRRRDLRGRSINDGKFSSTDMVSVTHTRCPHARANGWAARCRPTCSTCSGHLGGAAAAGRTMVRSPAAPSPVRFSGLLFADSGADDGARAVGATDDDVGFAWSARWRRRDLRGRSINDGKFSSTDMVRLASLA